MRKLTYFLFSLLALMLFVSPLTVQAATQAEIDACISSPDCKYIDGELLKKRTLPDGQIVFGLPSQVHPNDKKVVNGQTQWRYHGYNEFGDPYTNSAFPHDADSGRSVCQKDIISNPWKSPWWRTSENEYYTEKDWDYILSNVSANTGCLDRYNTKILHYNPDTGAFSVRVWHRNSDGSIWYETFDNFQPPPPPKVTCDNLNLKVNLAWGGTKVLDYLPADISNTVSVSINPPAGTIDQLDGWSVVYDDQMMMSAESGTFSSSTTIPIDGNITMGIEREDKGNVFTNNVVAKVTLKDGTVCTRAARFKVDARGEPPPPSMPSGKMPSGITNVQTN